MSNRQPPKMRPNRPPTSETAHQTIDRLLSAGFSVTTAEVAAAAGVSRQAAHKALSKMVDDGQVVPEGKARATRYRSAAQRTTTYPIDGNTTDLDVWGAEKLGLRAIDPDAEEPNVIGVLNFAFTEMVNNALDHSEGTELTVRWFVSQHRIGFEVEDDGIGVFASMRESRHLADDFQAIGELSKGKQTTDPQHHAGLGIFFTSRLVDRFVLSSGRFSWKVDRERDDYAVSELDRRRRGTLVHCEVQRDTTRTLNEIRIAHSDPVTHKMDRTTLRVDLFEQGDFVSRTEAKLIGARLEGWDVVELDFSGVVAVGQGFADELFRVWAHAHPDIRLVPTNANQAVTAMIASVEQ
jgi:anti-sigma regulatory factor (Ser/Thr protein kinase)